jgi:hypothetical protein
MQAAARPAYPSLIVRLAAREIALVLAIAGVALLGASSAAAQPMSWGSGCDPALPEATRTSSTCGSILDGKRAIPPANAPAEVKAAIEAANRLVHRPYVWGGGHQSWWSRGYDCSGAVGYALHGADQLDTTMVSGQLALWGLGGTGRWITVYANYHHVYMVVAGLRFDTRDNPPGETGPRWHTDMVDPSRFVARHPAGL